MRYIAGTATPESQLLEFRDILLPRSSGNSKRVMLVVSHTDREDVAGGALLDDRNFAYRIYDSVFKYAGHPLDDLNLLGVPADAFADSSRAGHAGGFDSLPADDGDKDQAAEMALLLDEHNSRYVMERIEKFQPQVVIGFGVRAAKFLHGTITDKVIGKAAPELSVGIPLPAAVKDTAFTLMLSPCPVMVSTSADAERSINLLGYISRLIDDAINEERAYSIAGTTANTKIHLIDTMERYEKFLDLLWDKKVWAIDTEAINLSRVANSLQIIQFSDNAQRSFVLPVKHKDAKWTADELNHILRTLGDYFYDNDADYHIYHNAPFDLPMLRSELGIAHYCADVWDTMAGEFALDENMAEIFGFRAAVRAALSQHEDEELDDSGKKARAVGYHSLLGLTVAYGDYGYLTGEFGKEQRADIHALALNTPGLVKYCAYDTSTIFALHEQQKLAGKDQRNKHYQSTVRNLISDQLNMFGTLHFNGELADVDYLWRINAPTSKISVLIADLEKKLYAHPEVKAAEKILMKESGRQGTRALLGADVISDSFFSFNKAEHIRVLFQDIMGLESTEYLEECKRAKKFGKEMPKMSFGKEFKDEFRDNPLVAQYADYGKAIKLRQAFLTPLLVLATTNEDSVKDKRIRSRFKFHNILTGRVASTEPNMQQVPSHGPLAKAVKRIFVAPKGSLYIKVDFSAHELRLWSVIAQCPDLAGSFQKGLDWIAKFRKEPIPEYAEKFVTEGDIHKINASLFFKMAIKDVDDVIRSAVKGIAFGSIYGRSLTSLAKALKLALDMVEKVYAAFFERLPKAASWLLDIEKVAQKQKYVESNMHRRRYLFGFILNKLSEHRRIKGILNALGRRARNSPIQGMGSDLGFSGARLCEKIVWAMTKHIPRWREKLPLRNCNMVHDSSEMEAEYCFVMPSIEIIEYALTTGNQKKAKQLYGMDFPVGLAIEMEIGGDLSHMEKWAVGFRDHYTEDGKPVYKLDANGNRVQKLDKKKQPMVDKQGEPVYALEQVVSGDFNHLYDIIKHTLEYQNEEHKHDIDVEKTLRQVFNPKNTPKFLVDMAKNGYFKHAEKYGYDVYDDSKHLSLEDKIETGQLDWALLV